jgi:hypothetical protein
VRYWSIAAVLADVQQPWLAQTSTSWDGQFVPVKPPTPTKLKGTVGPRATISLTTAGGSPVKSLKAGVYEITARDLSTTDNFHLTSGFGLNRRTGVLGRATVIWKLALDPGVYRYSSDAHPTLRGFFTVRPAALQNRRRTASSLATFAPQERTLASPLDGVFQATVSGTANATLELIDPAAGQDLVAATPGAISFTVCGQRSLLLRVLPGQAGSFHVDIATP